MPGAAPVGLVGLGLMGDLCAPPHRRGVSVIGFDVDAAKMKRLAQIGGRAGTLATSRGPATRSCSRCSTRSGRGCGRAPPSSRRGWQIVICTSTCDPDRVAALGARVADRLRFEAPVSGTSEQVRQADGSDSRRDAADRATPRRCRWPCSKALPPQGRRRRPREARGHLILALIAPALAEVFLRAHRARSGGILKCAPRPPPSK